MNLPVLNKSNQRLGVCAPSARFDRSRFDRGIKQLESLGFRLEIPERIFAEKRYLAGDDLDRARVINRLYADPDIDAVICARGGFGAMRILPYLDWDLIKHNPKPLIGFSDITAMLLAVIDRTQGRVIHGPTVSSLADADAKTIESFIEFTAFTTGPKAVFAGDCLIQGDGRTEYKGEFKGGNISTISHLIGTPFVPNFDQAVLFLEDVNEPAYKIDRMLTQMKMAGMFDRIKGVVTGSFESCANSEYIDEILTEVFSDCQVPVLTGVESGHGPVNLSIPMGLPAVIHASSLKVCFHA